MGLHKPFDRSFFVIGGKVMTSGGSLQLAKGQFGIFDTSKASPNGLEAVSSFKGRPKKTKYEIKVGKTDVPVTRSQSNKSFSSYPFKVSDVTGIKVSVPNKKEQEVDELAVGYNGIDPDTAITFRPGSRYNMVVRLSGESIGLLGYKDNYVDINVPMEAGACPPYESCDDCDNCAEVEALPIITKAVEFLKNFNLRGGVPVKEFIEVSPTKDCTTAPVLTETPYKFMELSVDDLGDDSALAIVQSQYPENKVVRVGRNGTKSVYQVVIPSDGTISDYQVTIGSLIKGCETCPSGYTATNSGFVYAITLEDDGVDKTADIQLLPNAVEGTAEKSDTQNDGVGFYTVLLSQELSDTDLNTFIASNPTATVSMVSEVDALCNPDVQPAAVAWVENGTCNVAAIEYKITLPDNTCGQDRLSELQSAYPDMNVQLEGTSGGCQTVYKGTVNSELVCDECNDIFKDYFHATQPESYDGVEWEQVTDTLGTGCKVGIHLKGKVLEVHPNEYLINDLGFIDNSVNIQVSGGFIRETLATDTIIDKPFAVTYLSKAKKRSHLGGNLRDYEERSNTFFTGSQRHKDYVAKMLTGQETNISYNSQYVDYAVTIKRNYFSQGFSDRETDYITYHVFVEVGKHQDVEELLNKLATASGLESVKAYG